MFKKKSYRQKNIEYCKRRYKEYKRLGICLECCGVGIKGKARCLDCLKKSRERTAMAIRNAKAAGLCSGCLRVKPRHGYLTCDACLKDARDRRRRPKIEKLLNAGFMTEDNEVFSIHYQTWSMKYTIETKNLTLYEDILNSQRQITLKSIVVDDVISLGKALKVL